jgi:hypothetical protein
MNNRSDGFSCVMLLNCGVMDGLFRNGGVGIGDGGSICTDILFISLLRLHVRLEQ